MLKMMKQWWTICSVV